MGNWFLRHILHWTVSEVDEIGEIDHGAFSDGDDEDNDVVMDDEHLFFTFTILSHDLYALCFTSFMILN